MSSHIVSENALTLALNNELKRIASYVGEIHLSVGVHGDETVPYPNGKTVAWVAAINTVGYKDGDFEIPARPFLKPGIREAESRITGSLMKGIRRKKSPEEIVASAGEIAVNSIVSYIERLKIPANRPFTIARKGADNPLIDTGQLKSSISWRWDNG